MDCSVGVETEASQDGAQRSGSMHRDWRSVKRRVKVWIGRRRFTVLTVRGGTWAERGGTLAGRRSGGTGHGQGAKGHGQGGEGNGLVGTEHCPTDAESCRDVVAGGFTLRGEGGILMTSVTRIIKNTVNRPGGRAARDYVLSLLQNLCFVEYCSGKMVKNSCEKSSAQMQDGH
jgi:hypothetical protein